jgi:hypothetical protein
MTSGQCYSDAVLDHDAGAVKKIRCARKSNITRKSEEEVCLQDLQDRPGVSSSPGSDFYLDLFRGSLCTVRFTDTFKFTFKVA